MKLSIRPARRLLLRVLLVVGSVLIVVALLVFEPWKLVVDRQVDEPPPAVIAAAAPSDPGPATSAPVARTARPCLTISAPVVARPQSRS